MRTELMLLTGVWLAAAGALADTKVEFMEEGSKKPGSTMYISDGRMRIDMADADGEYAVFDAKAQTLTNVNPGDREYTVMDAATMQQFGAKMAAARKQMEAQMANMPPEQRAAIEKMMSGAAGQKATKPVYKRTGKRSKVSGYDCEIVSYEIAKQTGELCVAAAGELDMTATDVKTIEQFGTFLDHMTSSLAEMGFGGRMNFSEIGGLPVSTRDGTDPAEIVKSVSHDSQPASLFAPPAGYKLKKLELEE